MDRYYLGKFVEEINAGARKLLSAALGDHLVWLLPLDRDVDVGESHLKVLRYIYSIDKECPTSRLLSIQALMETFCKRNSGTDVTIRFHFGADAPPMPENDSLLVMLRFYLLEPGASHFWNRLQASAVMDDPERLESLLPPWLNLDAPMERHGVEDEILCFCQQFLSSDCGQLQDLRDFEAGFWRVVNLACSWLDVETFEDIVALLPARFVAPIQTLPADWQALRKLERSFSQEAFVACSRSSFRFCQLLTELRRPA